MKQKALKSISLLCALAAVLTAATGCGTGNPSESSSAASSKGSQSTSQTQKANIRFSWWGGDERHTATMKALEEFNKAYPDIKVDIEYQGYDGYHDKMFTQLAGGTAPDLFQYNPENMPEVVGEKKLAELDSFVSSGALKLEDVSEGSLVDAQVDGKLYGIPMSTQTICTIYNKTLFDQVGVAYPADDWTWEDYDKLVKELKQKLPDGVFPSTDLRAQDICTLAMVHQKGGSYVTADGKLNFKDTITWPLETFQTYLNNGLVPPAEETLASTGDTIFMEGRAAIHATFNAMATSLQSGSVNKDEFALTSIPSGNTGDKLGMYVKGEIAFCVSGASKNQDAAVTLLNEFVNNLEMGKVLGLTRGIPPSEKVREAVKANMTTLDQDVFKVQEMADNSSDTPEPRLMKGWLDVLAVVAQETDEYRFGRKDLETAVNDMTDRAQKDFDAAQ